MRLIKPHFEIIEQGNTIDDIYKHIELCGRVCYKSEDKITENSAKKFVDNLIKSGHGSVLEHGTVYLKCEFEVGTLNNNYAYDLWDRYNNNRYSTAYQCRPNAPSPNGYVAISTNLRVLVENNWLDDLKYLCEPTEYHKRRYTVKVVCDRGVSHEFVRHRTMSFSQESTRYCNYSKSKFNNEITFISPCWMSDFHLGVQYSKDIIEEYRNFENWTDNSEVSELLFLYSLAVSEQAYFDLLANGWKPQEARSILPNALKTELVVTGFGSDWKHFFELRTSTAAHPQAREIAVPLQEEFIKRRYI